MSSLQVGIVGFPNSGKSTLLNALSNAGAQVAPYPFTTVDPNIGVVPVPDERLGRVAELAQCSEVVPATVRFIDIAGLVEGASRGEGLGNRFLASIREVDAIVHVIRCFESEAVSHVAGSIDPERDAELIETELRLADLDVLERAISKASRDAKSGKPDAKARLEGLHRVAEIISGDEGTKFKEARAIAHEFAKDLGLICIKPAIVVLNFGHEGVDDAIKAKMQKWADYRGFPLLAINAEIESEISELDPAEADEYRQAMGIGESGLGKVVRESYRILGLITFFSVDSEICRAWPIPEGTCALDAAGKIHTDFMRGFIKADVVHYDDFLRTGSFSIAREKGCLLVEGKEYKVCDGDVIHFKFAT